MWILNTNFFAAAYLMENRASKNYKYFIESFHYYQELNQHTGNINDILELPYPLFYDIVMYQITMKKKEIERKKKEQNRVQISTR